MLSVLKHTKTPVKFWFLKNYLSSGFMVRLNEFLCLFTTSQLDIFLICILRRTKTLRKIDVSQSVILRRTKVSFVFSLHLPNARPVFFCFFFVTHTAKHSVLERHWYNLFYPFDFRATFRSGSVSYLFVILLLEIPPNLCREVWLWIRISSISMAKMVKWTDRKAENYLGVINIIILVIMFYNSLNLDL